MPEQAQRHRVSARAKRMWGRLQDWYGDAMEQYGPIPPADWCEVIDSASTQTDAAVLADLRSAHTKFPPRFPEFEALYAKHAKPISTGPSMIEQLCEYVTRTKPLTKWQAATTWTYLYRGHPGHAGDQGKPGNRPSPEYSVTAVIVPADGDAPGYRVTVEDLQLSAAA